MASRKLGWLISGVFLLGCAQTRAPDPRATTKQTEPPRAVSPTDSRPEAVPAGVRAPLGAGADERALAQFEGFLKEQGELEVSELEARFKLTKGPEKPLGFDPTQVRYFDLVKNQLKLTAEERRIFRARGVVGVDHVQRYSMASAYYAIYTRDLPVLVTSDSVLHALHRSFDQALMDLESTVFVPAMKTTLSRTSDELAKAAKSARPELRQSLEDVDLYLTVARNLLQGVGAPSAGAVPEKILISPELVRREVVEQVVDRIASLRMDSPDGPGTVLYGSRRFVDFSQFRPRGHYARDEELKRYFRTMMWLGRPDVGWNLRGSGNAIDPDRERRDAALMVMLLARAGEVARLGSVSRIIDFMVGRSDNTGIADVQKALERAKINGYELLADPAALGRFDAALDEVGVRAQQIRGQVMLGTPGTTPTKLPLLFQVFGQRFVIDSFALSRVVYDSIVYKNEKQMRHRPSGLDVTAVLGNDEAVRLLRPELDQWHYASNLLAARRVVESMTPDDWRANAYNQWLAALRTLDDVPAGRFPEVMRREAWQRKQLQTTLGSWSELRHDSILYAKQSYTAATKCEYPTGYVEPYPAFFEALRALTQTLSERIGAADVPQDDPARAKQLVALRDRQKAFFAYFASTMLKLKTLAQTELDSVPFSTEDAQFLKKTIDIRGGGSGPPTYDGWYPRLIYSYDPSLYEPVVADVHTDPDSQQVLEEAVGDVNFLVVAADNAGDPRCVRRPYVLVLRVLETGRCAHDGRGMAGGDSLRLRAAPPGVHARVPGTRRVTHARPGGFEARSPASTEPFRALVRVVSLAPGEASSGPRRSTTRWLDGGWLRWWR